MKTKIFEKFLQAELDKLPYTKHLDDGSFNDGRVFGFEEGARWMKNQYFTILEEFDDADMNPIEIEWIRRTMKILKKYFET